MRTSKVASRTHPYYLALECVGLFVIAPAMGAMMGSLFAVIPMLLLVATCCALMLHFRYNFRWRDAIHLKISKNVWSRIFTTYFIAIIGLTLLLWWIKPDALFSLLLQHTTVWLLIMIAYPLLSVIPQEVIYRVYFFKRYRLLFGDGNTMVLVSAMLFSFGHILFHNWVAIFLTLLAGWIFGTTCRRTASLSLVCIEHALYGCAAFTIGYGQFFFDHTMQKYR